MNMTDKTETVKETKEVKKEVLKVNNNINPVARVEYIAVCDFTTLKNGVSTQIKSKEVLTARDIPQVWLDQAEGQRLIIKKRDLEKMTANDLLKLGYPKNIAK